MADYDGMMNQLADQIKETEQMKNDLSQKMAELNQQVANLNDKLKELDAHSTELKAQRSVISDNFTTVSTLDLASVCSTFLNQLVKDESISDFIELWDSPERNAKLNDGVVVLPVLPLVAPETALVYTNEFNVLVDESKPGLRYYSYDASDLKLTIDAKGSTKEGRKARFGYAKICGYELDGKMYRFELDKDHIQSSISIMYSQIIYQKCNSVEKVYDLLTNESSWKNKNTGIGFNFRYVGADGIEKCRYPDMDVEMTPYLKSEEGVLYGLVQPYAQSAIRSMFQHLDKMLTGVRIYLVEKVRV